MEILSQTNFQIVPLTLTNSRRDTEVHTNALLDKGSDTTLIQKDIAGKLQLTGIRAMNSQRFPIPANWPKLGVLWALETWGLGPLEPFGYLALKRFFISKSIFSVNVRVA